MAARRLAGVEHVADLLRDWRSAGLPLVHGYLLFEARSEG